MKICPPHGLTELGRAFEVLDSEGCISQERNWGPEKWGSSPTDLGRAKGRAHVIVLSSPNEKSGTGERGSVPRPHFRVESHFIAGIIPISQRET